jgi:hypothetical protein
MTVQTLHKSRIHWPYLLLALYDLLLAAGALYGSILMLSGTGELFSSFPTAWVGKLPFGSWTPIGCIALFFALGNASAAILCLTARRRRGAMLSVILGILLAVGMVVQILVLGETYLATGQFLLAAFLQIIVSLTLVLRHRFVAPATEQAQ